MEFLALGGLMLDDIVFPDGRTAMGTIGGSGAYTAAAMRLWADEVGVFARVASDFDRAALDRLGLRSDAVRITDRPTPRAWQLYEADGTRTQVRRVSDEDWQAQLAPTVDALPDLAGVRGVHMAARGFESEGAVIGALVDAGVCLSVEPVIYADTPPERRARVLGAARRAAVFSPGLAEARLLLGDRPEPELLRGLAALGCEHLILRRGERGAVHVARHAERTWEVPPAAASPLDFTGAGNAFCGGFLVGWVVHGELDRALAQAAVSAAVTLEHVGVPHADDRGRDSLERRVRSMLAALRAGHRASPAGIRPGPAAPAVE